MPALKQWDKQPSIDCRSLKPFRGAAGALLHSDECVSTRTSPLLGRASKKELKIISGQSMCMKNWNKNRLTAQSNEAN